MGSTAQVACALPCEYASEDDSGSTISKEAAGDEIGHGRVILLPGERTEFDREQNCVLFRKGSNIVSGAGDTRCSSDATEAKDWRALDVSWEAHEVDETGVNTRAGNAGDRGEEDS